LATLLLGADGVTETPVVVVAVAVAYVITMILPPAGPDHSNPEPESDTEREPAHPGR
jgi:hypothetical protein